MTTCALPPTGACDMGVVWGTSCCSRNFFKDMGAIVQNTTVGGELITYSELLAASTERALARLEKRAAEMGADGVYAVYLATPQVAGGAAEVIAYGTAYRQSEKATLA